MSTRLRLILFAVALPLGAPVAAADLVADFASGKLDSQIWDGCQLDGVPLKFEVQSGPDGRPMRVLRNVVDPATGNRNDLCQELPLSAPPAPPAANGATEIDGPSLVEPSPLEALNVPECPAGGPDYQRNELRLRQRPDLVHAQDQPHWYAITFHVDGDIPSCGSARWILAQWKQERDGTSPFLAERFDNGVLHVTVQNGDCRCVVAQAQGDMDAMALAFSASVIPRPALAETAPIKCIRSDVDTETLCQPSDLHLFTLGGRAPPSLPDPKRGWVTMTYFVRGGSDGQGRVDVYADNRFVVRVTGLIGYPSADPGPVKFKFGHYRDRIGGTASMSVARLCISPNVAVCAPGLRPQP